MYTLFHSANPEDRIETGKDICGVAVVEVSFHSANPVYRIETISFAHSSTPPRARFIQQIRGPD